MCARETDTSVTAETTSARGAPVTGGVPPVAEGAFTLPPHGADGPELLGGRCPEGHGRFFPRPAYCPTCLGPVDETGLGGEGVIYSFTVVRTRAPLGLPEPYSVGYVDLACSGLRVFGLLDPSRIDDLSVGGRVRLTVRPFGVDQAGESCLRPIFELLDGEAGAS